MRTHIISISINRVKRTPCLIKVPPQSRQPIHKVSPISIRIRIIPHHVEMTLEIPRDVTDCRCRSDRDNALFKKVHTPGRFQMVPAEHSIDCVCVSEVSIAAKDDFHICSLEFRVVRVK